MPAHGEKSRRAKRRRMLHRLICAAIRWGEPSRKVGSAAAFFAARPQSSVRVRRNSSLIVSTLIVSSIVFRPRQSRPSDGAKATEEAGASPETETKRRSASALAAIQPMNGAKSPKEGRGWCGWEMEKGRCLTMLRCAP
jgi:hypothetical protein